MRKQLKTALAGSIVAVVLTQGNETKPDTIFVTAKVRDFYEVPEGKLPNGAPDTYPAPHPHFNNERGCGVLLNAVVGITEEGRTDPNFPGDERNPIMNPNLASLSSEHERCWGDFWGRSRYQLFDDWYNDKPGQGEADTNRTFLMQLPLELDPGSGSYSYENRAFFPLDDDKVANRVNNIRQTKGQSGTFGHLTKGGNSKHNFGFTLELHTTFTYDASGNQEFRFSGDDDVWVFVDGKLVIDLGGVHSRKPGTFRMNEVPGLVDGESYNFDFYFAERHTSQSNLLLTTNIVFADTPTVQTPFAKPKGGTFVSSETVELETLTPNATIHYTVDGSDPTRASPVYTGGIPIIANTTLKAIAVRSGYRDSEIMTEVYVRELTQSSLAILDQDGNVVERLTEKNPQFTVRVITSQAGLDFIDVTAATSTKGDSETLRLTNRNISGDQITFTGTFDFRVSAGAPALPGTTEANFFDELTVTWVNPVVPADVASDTKTVRPAPQSAQIYFADGADGQPINRYAGTETTLHLVVVDQVQRPGLPYQVSVTSIPFGGGNPDQLTLPLTVLPSGRFGAVVPVDNVGGVNSADGSLQVKINDEVTAVYIDPLDGDSAEAIAGYGVSPEIPAKLSFVDESGNPLDPSTIWAPSKGKVYLRFEDDAARSPQEKPVTIRVQNSRVEGPLPGDEETTTFVLTKSATNGDIAVWTGAFDLRDTDSPTANNSVVETYFKGEVTAEVVSSTKSGGAGPVVRANLTVAVPNRPADIEITDGNGNPVTRGSDNIKVTIQDQDFSSQVDTIYANLTCTQSQDQLRLVLVEISPENYQSTNIPFQEGSPNPADDILTCRSSDDIVVTYTDPVYEGETQERVPVRDDFPLSIHYEDIATGDTITLINEAVNNKFKVVVRGPSPTKNQIDTITVSLTIPGGGGVNERENVRAVETAPFSQQFEVIVPYTYGSSAVTRDNGTVEALLSNRSSLNRTIVTGTAVFGTEDVSGDLALESPFLEVILAYIEDGDEDGRGDSVYFEFEGSVDVLPSSLDSVYWNAVLPELSQTAGAPQISRLTRNGQEIANVLVADFSESEFGLLTSIPPGEEPYALFPSDAYYRGQRPLIEDKIGPVITNAEKRASELFVQTDVGSREPEPDTLIVTLSEAIVTTTAAADLPWDELFLLSPSCNPDETVAIRTKEGQKPVESDEGLTWTVLLDPGSGDPLVGHCILLNENSSYTDRVENKVTPKLQEIECCQTPRSIQGVRGHPPVAGINANTPGFNLANSAGKPSSFLEIADNGFQSVEWVEPVGWDRNNPMGGYTVDPRTGTPDRQCSPDANRIVTLDPCLPTLQVVTQSSYIARISIHDQLGNFVRSSTQAFGFCNELENPYRQVDGEKGVASYLVWDGRDRRGIPVGQGVYLWKVVFTFLNDQTEEVEIVRTGYLRSEQCADWP